MFKHVLMKRIPVVNIYLNVHLGRINSIVSISSPDSLWRANVLCVLNQNYVNTENMQNATIFSVHSPWDQEQLKNTIPNKLPEVSQ